MSRHNRHLEDERLLVREQIQDYAEQVAEEQASLHRQREFEALYNTAAASTPAQLHDVLRTFLHAQFMEDSSAYHSEWAAEFFDQVGRDWEASARLSFAAGIGGAGLAAEAPARLGPRGRQALPRLREAVLSDRRDWHSAADRRIAFEAYAALCEEDTAVLALLDEVAAKGCLSDALLDPVVRIAREKSVFVAVLARLVQSRFWTRGSDYSNKVGWIDTIELLSERGRDAEVVLPALAAALDRPRDEYRGPEGMEYRAHAEEATRHFLDRLSAGPGARSPEDTFIVALRGVPSVDDAWLVYADWLEGRGDSRGEFLRLRQALARAGGPGEAGRGRELSQLRDTWLAAHGQGWAVLYDLVSEPIAHAPLQIKGRTSRCT